jgi:hypothetical protein
VMRRVSSAVDAAVRRIIAVVLWLRRPGRLRRLQRSSAADLASSARFQMAAGVMSAMTAKKTVRIDVRDSSECRRELRSPEGPSSWVDRRLGQRLLILWPASVDISRRVDTLRVRSRTSAIRCGWVNCICNSIERSIVRVSLAPSHARLDLIATRFDERHEGMRLVDRVRGTRLCNEKLAQEREGSCGL